MMLIPQFALPYPSKNRIDGPEFEQRGFSDILWLVIDHNGKRRRVEIVFAKPKASRYISAMFCVLDNFSDSRDTVFEVSDSPWIAELLAAAEVENRHIFVMRHFIIFIEGFGCLEIVAESAEMTEAAS